MVSATHLISLIATAVLGVSFPAARADAQTQPVNDVNEVLEVSVPWSLRNFSPDLAAVSVNCSVWPGAGRFPQVPSPLSVAVSANIPVSSLSKQADGSIVGTTLTNHVFKRPSSLSGTQGEVECSLGGNVPSMGALFVSASTNPTMDARFKVVGAASTIVKFTW